MSTAKKNIGELLVRENLINIEQLEQARKGQNQHGGRLTTALVRMGFVKETELAEFLGKQHNLPTVDLATFEIDPEATALVPKQFCEKNRVIPVQKADRTLVVAFADPTNVFVKDDLAMITRCKIEMVVASENQIVNAIERYYSTGNKLQQFTTEIEESEEMMDSGDPNAKVEIVDSDAQGKADPIIKFVNAMLVEAIKVRASDIHVEPYEKRFRIRFRIDGSLHEKIQPPPGAAAAIISRLKIMSGLDIAEKRRPQDGRLKVKLKTGQEMDFRVNVTPTLFGEKTVMRLLDKSNLQVDMTKLGFEPEQLDLFKRIIALPQGTVLITGPTGSGKTTTIYSALAELNQPDVNISTAEDPVEFNLEGINQVQVNAEIGFGFPEALRAFLRQDPEVIMVGEIRDFETASIAFKAASTGHLVVSTLHTNDASSTVARLVDMGVAPYVVSSAVNLITAQRLIKKVCKFCEVDHKVTDEVLLGLGVRQDELGDFQNIKKGEGCGKCNGTGLSGRIAIHEFMEMTGALREAIIRGKAALEIKKIAVEENHMITLRRSALLKLKRGITSVDEVINSSVGDDA